VTNNARLGLLHEKTKNVNLPPFEFFKRTQNDVGNDVMRDVKWF